jgi:hypothetical protein
MWRPGRFYQIEDPPVMGGEDVEMVRWYQGGRGRSGGRRKAGDGAGPRIDGLDLARVLDRDMHEAARRIEEGGIRRAAKRPLGAEFAGRGAERHKRAAVTSGIEAAGPVIDVEPMRTC